MFTPGQDPSGTRTTDYGNLLVMLERDVPDDAFFRYAAEFGDAVNYLPSIASAFLRLHSPDTDGRQIAAVRALPGVIWADYNMHHFRFQTYTPSDALALDNSAIYNELDLPTAWEITKGDPRIKIGVVDSGCDLRHPDINAQSGGVFMGGIHVPSSGGFPIKVDLITLFRQMWSSVSFIEPPVVQVFTYDPNRIIPYQQQVTPKILATVYTDSTCKAPMPTVTWGSDVYLADSYATFWVNQPVDIVLTGWTDEVSRKEYWHYGVGRFEMYDGYGHGTACTGIIAGKHDSYGLAGIAPDCTTIHYRCANDTADYIDDLSYLPALDKAVSDGCHIISTSIGSEGWDPSYLSLATSACFNRVAASNAVWFCAASNSGLYAGRDGNLDPYGYPASWPGALSIGACGDKAGAQNQDTGYVDDEPQFIDYSRITYYSNKNDKVFALAPGFGYIVHAPTQHSSLWRTRSGGLGSRYYVYQRSGGTSWATPAAAGVGALMLSKALIPYSNTDPAEVWAILNSVCDKNRVKSILAATVNPTVKLSIGGTANYGFGAGRIRAGAAVVAV